MMKPTKCRPILLLMRDSKSSGSLVVVDIAIATGNGVDEAVEFVEQLISGEEQRLGTEVKLEEDGDMYLEKTCLDLGCLGTRPLSFSEGKSGGLVRFRIWVSWV